MKKIVLLVIIVVLGGVGYIFYQNFGSYSNSTTIEKYVIPEGEIWADEPENCDEDFVCLADAAAQCSPARGNFSSDLTNARGEGVTIRYVMGIQGERNGDCQMFYKNLDGGSSNYSQCRFKNRDELSSLLKKEPREFISDASFLFDIYDDNISAKCEVSGVYGEGRLHQVQEYMLALNGRAEDASLDLSIDVVDMAWGEKATFRLSVGDRNQTFTLKKDEQKTILGYVVRVRYFGSIENDAQAVSFTISK